MSGLDWPGLMRAGMTGLQIRPEVFWDLTPMELQLLLGPALQTPSLDRSGLEALMRRFPDQMEPDLGLG
ncbi:MAG: hypothetical protein BM558_06780 [Roseobacter sp. MedPE-SW]|nr:MAG: hypothetical protein BM558_06780 [Roseobacter sp. MedPE-SW]